MLSPINLTTGKIYDRIRSRTRWREFLGLLEALRARWPGEQLHVVLGGISPHTHSDVRARATIHDIEPVFLPTYGSCLNRVESEFAALRQVALNGTGHRSHSEQNARVAAYVGGRNSRAEPKTRRAPNSPVR
ncbi:transposase [Streptomyces sp. NPDC057694]|uniref:transposase n=1 Tax=Streptomyces sp. NPDC057694 TaxID=3346216 RepID=UPI0036CD765D